MADEEFVPRDDSAAALFRSMEDGQFMDACGAELRRAIVDLRAKSERFGRRSKGSITIKVDLEVDPKGVLETEAEIVVKLPKSKRSRSIHWTDDQGDILNRRAERQLELKPVATKNEDATEAKPGKEPKKPAVKAM